MVESMKEEIMVEEKANKLIKARAQPPDIVTSMERMVTQSSIAFGIRRKKPTTSKRKVMVVSS